MQRDIPTEFKELRLHGMAGAWQELTTHEGKYTDVGIQTSRWLIEHLLQARGTLRAQAIPWLNGLHHSYRRAA